jgi:hypothetical protein
MLAVSRGRAFFWRCSPAWELLAGERPSYPPWQSYRIHSPHATGRKKAPQWVRAGLPWRRSLMQWASLLCPILNRNPLFPWWLTGLEWAVSFERFERIRG